ncbi:MAG: MerR family transcriptional regulator [Phycisphaerae bacterium]
MSFSERFNIGQLAKTAGVPVTTVRYYERIGLLLPAGRTASNYRYYDRHSLERLRFIRLAHAGGFSINDIKSMLQVANGSKSSGQCRAVGSLIEQRLAAVRAQIGELKRLEKILADDLQLCRDGKPGRCAVVEQLQTAAKG